MTFPARIDRKSHKQDSGKRSPAHRAWVRGHACCACGSEVAIECAHVRDGTGGGMSMKPSDRWCISLCRDCHQKQHKSGEGSLGIDMKALAVEFVKRSPHRTKLEAMP
jgi:hypothetical protein